LKKNHATFETFERNAKRETFRFGLVWFVIETHKAEDANSTPNSTRARRILRDFDALENEKTLKTPTQKSVREEATLCRRNFAPRLRMHIAFESTAL
jgi:hypothetical protein